MPIEFSLVPAAIDALHLVLAVLVVLLLVIATKKPSAAKPSTPVETSETQTDTGAPDKKPVPTVQEVANTSALQLLSLLQQEARFIDFVHEDLSAYSDADIGAAARVVHEGSKKTLQTYLTLVPVRGEEEESRITLEPGFDAAEVRLTGNVVGTAPFTGTLVHRGWKATETRLPSLASGHDARILAPAEVEL